MNKNEIFQKIAQILEEKGAKKVSVFGSYARDQENPESDIDIMVTFSTTKSLLELVRIERELCEEIGIKVDLVTEKSLSPYIRKQAEKEMKDVFG